MVKKNKTIDLCPGNGGCASRGVLQAPRMFGGGISTATQATFDKMKQIQPDLSRATANAMLGLSVHPYRKIPNDKLVPKHTATDKFFNPLNNQVSGNRQYASTQPDSNQKPVEQDTNIQPQMDPQITQQIAPQQIAPSVSSSSDNEITLTIPPSPTLSKSSSSGSNHSPFLSPESSPDSSPKLPPYNMKANTAASTFTSYSGAGSSSGSSSASTFFPNQSSPSTSPNASALFNIGSPTGKMVSKEVDKIQNKPKSPEYGASGLITQQPISPATSIGQTKPKKKKKPISESKEVDLVIKEYENEKKEDFKKQKLIAQQNKGKGKQGKAKQF